MDAPGERSEQGRFLSKSPGSSDTLLGALRIEVGLQIVLSRPLRRPCIDSLLDGFNERADFTPLAI